MRFRALLRKIDACSLSINQPQLKQAVTPTPPPPPLGTLLTLLKKEAKYRGTV